MEIQTPRGKIFINTATMKAELVWNPEFAQRKNREYGLGSPLQKFIDNEYLRTVQPYVPLKTGMLANSATLGTQIGEGLIRWIAPYARRQFHEGRAPGESETGALRGRQWHERWKADNLTSFMASVQRKAKGG